MRNKTTLATLFLTVSTMAGLFLTVDVGASPSDLAKGFAVPPQSARPWVYWFWLDGNITREGITADLEAMRRVGIGGVLIMEVDQGAPKGPARFASPQWRELFKFMLAEANRLGLEVNMNNDAGWCGSGGPWITPALAMQKVVWTTTTGGRAAPFRAGAAGAGKGGGLLRGHCRAGVPDAGGIPHREHPGQGGVHPAGGAVRRSCRSRCRRRRRSRAAASGS